MARRKAKGEGGGGSGPTGSGAANRIAFWSSPTNLTYSDNLQWINSVGQLDLFYAGNGTLRIKPDTGFFAIGNWSGGANGCAWVVDETIGIYGQASSGRRFLFDTATAIYTIGDVDNTNGGNKLIVHDNTASIYGERFGSLTFNFELATKNAYIGDVSGVAGSMKMKLDNVSRTATFGNDGNPLDGATGNLTKLYIDDSAQDIYVTTRFGFNAINLLAVIGTNTSIGRLTLNNLTLGTENTVFGHRAGEGLSSGSGNTIFGSQAGAAITTGNTNIIGGQNAMRFSSNVNSGGNIAFGSDAASLVGGFNNIVMGNSALANFLVSDDQLAIGTAALRGDTLVPGNNTGIRNQAIGYTAGANVRSGSYNQIFGWGADVAAASTDYATVYGYQSTAATSGIAIGAGVVAGANELKFGSATSPIYTALIGDYAGAQNSTYLSIVDSISLIETNSSAVNMNYASTGANIFTANIANLIVAIGDNNGVGNSTKVTIDDPGKNINLRSDGTVTINNNAGQGFLIDFVGKDYALGDLQGVGNHNLIWIEDDNNKISARTPGIFQVTDPSNVAILYADIVNGIFSGGDTTLANNGFRFAIVDSLKTMDFASPDGLSRFGDIDSSGNGTQFTIDDTNQRIFSNRVFGLGVYTVGTLPAGSVGDTAYVTDATAPAWHATVVGGGAVKTPVFFDGTNWIVI